MNILFHPFVFLAVLIVALALFLRYTLRRKRKYLYSTELEKVTLTETWHSWIEMKNSSSSEDGKRDELLNKICSEDLAAIRDDLATIDKQKFSMDYPLTQIRLEIMASVDRHALNGELLQLPVDIRQQVRQANPEILQDDSEAERYLAANELRLLVLREYASRRFGDRAKSDWLEVYLRAARIKQRSLHRMIENSVQDNNSETTVRLQAIQLVDEKLREQLLRVPPGTVFEGLAI